MPIVSNTSPLLNLAIVGQLDLVRQQFGQILIPPEVLNELKPDENRPGSAAIQHAVAQGWLQVQSPDPSTLSLFRLLEQNLDRGEAAAITLAISVQAEWTLLDERDGRKTAKSLGLQVTGILGILIKAKQTGVLPQVKPVLNDLVQIAGFRIAPDLLARLEAIDAQSSPS